MELTIQYYGVLSEIAGKDSEKIFMDMPASTVQLKERLIRRYPAFRDHTLILFSDAVKCTDSTEIKQGSMIDCMPPFSGG